MLDHHSSADFDHHALAEALGALPDAPLAMPKQALEPKTAGLGERLSDRALRLLRPRAPRPGL
jgi:hypothetical protein